MYLEIYGDSLFALNLICNLMLLKLTQIRKNSDGNRKRLFLAAVFGAVFQVVFFFPIGPFFLRVICFGVLGTVGMLLIAFPIHSIRGLYNMTGQYLMLTILFHGTLLLFGKCSQTLKNSRKSIVGLVFFMLVFFLFWYWESGRNKSEKERSICQVMLVQGDLRVPVKALVDSGNSLTEPISGEPVCIVDSSTAKRLELEKQQGFRAIPYHSIGKRNGILRGYLLEEMILDDGGLKQKRRQVYVAVSEENLMSDENAGVGMIVNPALLRRRCEK